MEDPFIGPSLTNMDFDDIQLPKSDGEKENGGSEKRFRLARLRRTLIFKNKVTQFQL